MIIEKTKNEFGETIEVKAVDREVLVLHSDISVEYLPISKIFLENVLSKDEVVSIACMAFRIGLQLDAKEGEFYEFPEYKFGEFESVITLSKFLRENAKK